MKNREFEVVIELKTTTKAEAIEKIRKSFNVVSVKCLEKRRSTKQNRALHLFFTLLATALNDAGYDMKKTINKELDIKWTSYNVKEFLWRPLQKSMTGKRSTTQIKTNQIDEVYDVLNKIIGERTGVFVEFPCIDTLIQDYN